MSYIYELAGKRFGFLTVTNRAYLKKSWYWECICDCGKNTIVQGAKLTSGHTKSCGHLRIEKVTSHKISTHPLYHVWYSMIRRCNDKSHKNYVDYGKRGIKVCKKWENDVLVFYKWAILNGYAAGLQLDREDNNKGYFPNNCRFVTKSVNQNNKRNNVFLTFNDETLTKAQWGRKLNIAPNMIAQRLHYGWTVEKTLSTPKLKIKKMKAKKFVLSKYPNATAFPMIDNARGKTSYVILKHGPFSDWPTVGLEIFTNEGATTASKAFTNAKLEILKLNQLPIKNKNYESN